MQLQVFTFQQQDQMGDLTAIEIKGETWFLVSDVCRFLEIQNNAQSIQSVDGDDKLLYTLHIAGQNRKTWFVNESGLYNLIFRSNKSSANRFKRWVTKEVLPSIRKTGSYGIDRSALPN